MTAPGDTYGVPPPFDEEIAGAPFPPPHWFPVPGGRPADDAEMNFPADDFHDLAPQAAAEPAMQFPPDDFADLKAAPSAPDAEMNFPADDFSTPVEPDWSGLTGAAPPAAPAEGVDAISGGALPPPTPELDPTDPYGPGPVDAAINEQMAQSPEERARIEARRLTDDADYKRKLEQDAQIANERKIAEENTVWKAGNDKATKESNEVQAEAKALSEASVDNDHWWNTRDTGQKVASYVTAILGGLLSAGKGPNEGLAMIFKAMDDDIETQKANLGHRRAMLGDRRSAVAEQFARNNDAFKSAEIVRIASRENLAEKIANEVASRDPKSAAAALGVAMISKVQEDRAAKVEAHRKTAFTEGIATAKQKLDEQQRADAVAQNKQTNAQAWARINAEKNAANAAAVPDRVMSQAEILADYGEKVPKPMTEKALQSYLGVKEAQGQVANYKAQSEIHAIDAAQKKGADSRALGDPGRPGTTLMKADGTVFHAPTDPEATTIREAMATTQSIREGVDKLEIMIAEHGGSSETFGSAENQEATAIITSIDLANAVANKLGAISIDDFTHIKNLAGGKRPSSFVYDASAGLEAMAGRLESKINGVLAGQGYDGPAWKPRRIDKAEALERSPEVNKAKALSPWPTLLLTPEESHKVIEEHAAAINALPAPEQAAIAAGMDQYIADNPSISPDAAERLKKAARSAAAAGQLHGLAKDRGWGLGTVGSVANFDPEDPSLLGGVGKIVRGAD